MVHRVVTLAAGTTLGPAKIPGPELLVHGPLTIYSQVLTRNLECQCRPATRPSGHSAGAAYSPGNAASWGNGETC